jgi:hypothetical protein
LRNTHDLHLAMPPMAVTIAITFCNGIIHLMDDVRSLLQHLQKSYKATYSQRVTESTLITDMITSIIGLSTGRVQDSGVAIRDCVAAPSGKYNYPRIFLSGYQVQFATTIVNYYVWHLIGRPNRIVLRRESYLSQLYSISSTSQRKLINPQPANTDMYP